MSAWAFVLLHRTTNKIGSSSLWVFLEALGRLYVGKYIKGVKQKNRGRLGLERRKQHVVSFLAFL